MLAVESSDASARGACARWASRPSRPTEKGEFLRRPMDALVVNASGGSLDPHTVSALAATTRLRVVCGSENLVMPDHAAGSEALRKARKKPTRPRSSAA